MAQKVSFSFLFIKQEICDMRFLLYLLIGAASIAMLYFLFIFLSFRINRKWFEKFPGEGKITDINGKKVFMRVKGEGDTIVVINATGSSQAEWWPVQDTLGHRYRVITYDRSGYGWSTADEKPKTVQNICDELDLILNLEGVDKPVYIVSGGTGAIYALYFAMTRPGKTAGVLFINPVPYEYDIWLDNVNYTEDFCNIFETAQRMEKYASKGVYRILNPLRGYKPDKKYKRYIAEHYTRIENYKTIKAELDELVNSARLLKNNVFPPVPLRILNTSIEFLIREWVKNGASEYSARQLGRLLETIIKDYMLLSSDTVFVEVTGTGEHIHLSQPEKVAEEISEMINGHNIKKAAH